MRRLLPLLLLLLAPWAYAQGPAVAAPAAAAASPPGSPADPYQAAVAVADQNEAARAAALPQALMQVLAQVSGLPAETPQLQALAPRASRWLQRYSYRRDAEGQLQLLAGFDPKAVDAALRAQNLPVRGGLGGGAQTLDVHIDGLGSVADYTRAMTAVRALPGLRELQVIGAEGARLQLQLQLEGGVESLAALRSHGLEPIPNLPLHFRFALNP